MRRVGAALAWAIAAVVVASGAKGCSAREGCLSGDDGTCRPVAACAKLSFASASSCADPRLEIRRIREASERSPGIDALASRNDILLANDRVRLVLDALDAPHALAPTGGNILDYTSTNGSDAINLVYHAVGILPRDAVAYRSIELEDAAPHHVGVILRGSLDGRPEITVVSRYELRACEPGVRVRTEVFHGGRDPDTWLLADASFWGNREPNAFMPIVGRGFIHPAIDLEKLGDSIAEQPFFAAAPQNDDESALAIVPCDRSSVEAFHSGSISASGPPRRVVLPGDGLAYERFVAIAPGPGLSAAADVALEARSSMFGEASVVIRGRVRTADGNGAFGTEREATIQFYEPAPGANPDHTAKRRPWNVVVPGADGSFSVRLPAGRAMRAEVSVLGRPIPEHAAFTSNEGSIPDLVVPARGVLDVTVHDSSGAPVLAELVLTPALDAELTTGSLFGASLVDHCSPWLGPAHGGSPGCNRALTDTNGTTSFAVPTGRFWAYATRGPFGQLARTRVDIQAGQRTKIDLSIDPLTGLVPDGVLGADFHVHGSASFDSSLPDRDRARTFVTQGLDVIAATDHDVVSNYEKALRELGLTTRVVVMPGVETTGQILFYEPPGFGTIPKVVGHYNFWPLPYDPSRPRNGAPWDERVEPGALFDLVSDITVERGVMQMNHPYSPSTFGRDEGFLTAINLDPRHLVSKDFPAQDTPEGQLTKRPNGRHSALDFDAQEVMNGTSTKQFLLYRISWHSFLSQGILRAGTANSDSHSLAVEVLGYPRNLVFGGHSIGNFDRVRFNSDVRAGHIVGTNGPVILASVDAHHPSIEPFTPSANAALSVEVRAAPWIPVEEIRIIVNGNLARTIREVTTPPDAFGKDGLVRYRGSIPLAELLAAVPPTEDAWIVVEAGLPLITAADLDDDGLPDTTDNDHNGVIDKRDQQDRSKEDWYSEPPRPKESESRFHAYAIAHGHYTAAFTNPFLIDRAGDGWKAPWR